MAFLDSQFNLPHQYQRVEATLNNVLLCMHLRRSKGIRKYRKQGDGVQEIRKKMGET